MDATDPQQSQRLQERYALMTADELQAVADCGYELTEIARQMLYSEIRQRGFDIRIKLKPDTPEEPVIDVSADGFDPASLDLVDTGRVWTREDAIRTKRILNSAGIPCYLGQNNLEHAITFNINFDKGVPVKVRYIDRFRAFQTLNECLPPDPEESLPFTGRDLQCPKCHSADIVFLNLESEKGAHSDLESTLHWSCDVCGHKWKDEGIQQQS
ncbi:MAG TPA: hypothetical protein VH079_03715 [Terriglobales bacterium]|jgi:DNA-directed RNA polymerase subunit M/transcription elongation factor TFIIS|nr:hypothetical protein [Terriglobales bacterium]